MFPVQDPDSRDPFVPPHDPLMDTIGPFPCPFSIIHSSTGHNKNNRPPPVQDPGTLYPPGHNSETILTPWSIYRDTIVPYLRASEHGWRNLRRRVQHPIGCKTDFSLKSSFNILYLYDQYACQILIIISSYMCL